MVESLPEPVIRRAAGIVGRPVTTDPLAGMSGSRVVRVAGSGGTLVAKANVSPRELSVYLTLPPVFADNRIRIPGCHGTVDTGDEHWLLLEDIPSPLPRERWLGDPAVMAILRRLHRLAPATLDALPDLFRPGWTEAMDLAALRWLDEKPDLASRLAASRHEAVSLFAPVGPISGDPNPLNWGLSRNGEIVLMDWERIGLGHPALDVAITVPGLPTLAELDRVRDAYRAAETSMSGYHDSVMTRLLVLAKLWTLVDFLSGTPPVVEEVDEAASGPIGRRQETAATVAAALPGWLRRVV